MLINKNVLTLIDKKLYEIFLTKKRVYNFSSILFNKIMIMFYFDVFIKKLCLNINSRNNSIYSQQLFLF